MILLYWCHDQYYRITKNAIDIIYNFLLYSNTKFEDTKVVMRSYKSKDKKYDCQQNKDNRTNSSIQRTTQNAKDQDHFTVEDYDSDFESSERLQNWYAVCA